MSDRIVTCPGSQLVCLRAGSSSWDASDDSISFLIWGKGQTKNIGGHRESKIRTGAVTCRKKELKEEVTDSKDRL